MSPDGPGPLISTGQLPDPEQVQAVLEAAHAACRDLDEGAAADYIPALAAPPPAAVGACIAGVTGPRYEVGRTTTEFST